MRVVAAVFAIASGLIVLLGYFIPVNGLLELRLVLLKWAAVLAATATLVGVVSLLGVHLQKMRTGLKNSLYSILLIFSLVITFLIVLLGTYTPLTADLSSLILEGIIVPVEATLMALLAVTLIYASVRLLRRRTDVMSFLFLAAALVVLLVSAPPVSGLPIAVDIKWFFNEFFTVAGARGILIGVALGALTTGLRVLFGIDRPYGGK